MSKYFTKYLAQIYPFFYQKNWKYFLEYEEYLTIEESNTKNKISPTSEGIKNHFNLGKSFINLKKFKEYFQKVFHKKLTKNNNRKNYKRNHSTTYSLFHKVY